MPGSVFNWSGVAELMSIKATDAATDFAGAALVSTATAGRTPIRTTAARVRTAEVKRFAFMSFSFFLSHFKSYCSAGLLIGFLIQQRLRL
jgi:hypothetical protein